MIFLSGLWGGGGRGSENNQPNLFVVNGPQMMELNLGIVGLIELFTSIKNEGIKEPITINLQWRAVDGNHRLAVARLLGIDTIDVRVWTETEFVL